MTTRETVVDFAADFTWRLPSRIVRDASGKPVDEPTLGSDPLALFYFDGAGNFAAQFQQSGAQAIYAASGSRFGISA